jgi:hypothetical protein
MATDLPITRSGTAASVLSLFTSGGTLICCALPALLVAVGAGAALSSLVSVFPQLVWLSEHKVWVFGVAGAALAVAGCNGAPASSPAPLTRRWPRPA